MALVLRVALAAAVTAAVAAVCPSPDWSPLFGKCYWASSPDFKLPWASAIAACDDVYPGSQLVSIHELTVQAFLYEKVLGNDGAWIGFNCTNVQQWLDGTPYDFLYWGNREEFREPCTRMYEDESVHGRWTCTAQTCEDTYRFLCEIDDV